METGSNGTYSIALVFWTIFFFWHANLLSFEAFLAFPICTSNWSFIGKKTSFLQNNLITLVEGSTALLQHTWLG